jgi:hypothetical protein
MWDSDRLPILLEIDKKEYKHAAPFEVNLDWLKEDAST